MINLEHIFDVEIQVDEPYEIGEVPIGNRRIINLLGGKVSGSKVNGKVLRSGADWQLVRRDGSAFLDARYILETDDGALLYVQNKGFRHGPPEVLARISAAERVDPSEYYMRCAGTVETADERYSWMNRTIFVSTGARYASSVELSFYEVL